ncbi:hypothetical protein DY000_02032155 [Brassica cretica]|uniref:Uncharacterized protein n=1 Tax=Brassica cretica TaxID=69181 RepID=A0ABQ7E062_BRACR|nr:hypothetical protein DY000_02032155 [Brassica cretica]
MAIGLYRPALSRPATPRYTVNAGLDGTCPCGMRFLEVLPNPDPRLAQALAVQARGTLIFRCATDGNPLPSLHTSTISLLSIHSTATKSHGCCLCNRLKLQSSDTLLCLTISNSLLLDTPTVLKVCETVFFVLPEPREGFNANLVNVFFFFLNGES